MGDRPSARFPKEARLRRGADFRRVLRRGMRVDGPLFTLWAAPSEGGKGRRLGLAASRRMGGAVARNRAKRLLRETFRKTSAPLGLDLVLVPKKAMVKSRQAEVDDEYQRILRRLARSPRKASGERPAAAD